jgi:putative aldouronate transport system permease protein
MMSGKRFSKVKLSTGDRIFTLINYAVCILIAISIIYPLYFIVIASFSSPMLIQKGEVWLLPKAASLSAYQAVFEYSKLWTGYYNTIIYTAGATIVSLLFTLPAAYALSRKDFSLRGIFMIFFLITMFFNGGLVPTYLQIKSLGMIDSYWVMVIPWSVNVFFLIIARTFYATQIPDELRQAAQIDGCSNTRFFLQIVMPLTGAIIAVIGLYVAVNSWNSYMNALIYLRTDEKKPLQIVLRTILILNEGQFTTFSSEGFEKAEKLKYALIIFSTVPIMCVYPFIQKYFTKGALMGSIKG